MTEDKETLEENTQSRDRWAKILMLVAALGALYALITSFGAAVMYRARRSRAFPSVLRPGWPARQSPERLVAGTAPT